MVANKCLEERQEQEQEQIKDSDSAVLLVRCHVGEAGECVFPSGGRRAMATRWKVSFSSFS